MTGMVVALCVGTLGVTIFSLYMSWKYGVITDHQMLPRGDVPSDAELQREMQRALADAGYMPMSHYTNPAPTPSVSRSQGIIPQMLSGTLGLNGEGVGAGVSSNRGAPKP